MFAHDADVRRDVVAPSSSAAGRRTSRCCEELFDLRHELANLVGYADWASYDAEVKMIGKGPAIPEFIDRIAAAAEEPMERDLAVLLERYRRDVPGRRARSRPRDASYYEELVRKEQHDVDSQRVRTYFAFEKVRQGLLDVTGRLFGLRYEPVPDAAGVARGRRRRTTSSGTDRATRRASAASTSTCTRARASTSTPRSSRSPTASPAGSCPRARWSATSAAG